MSVENIISKLKKSNLLGRSGSGFQTWLKWKMVKEAKSNKKYIVCNAASGEPEVLKDGYILENHSREVIEGIKIALRTIDDSSAYIYLRKDFYQKFKKLLKQQTKGLPITLFKKKGGYLAGEETAICQAIEGKWPGPRIKPPFPTEVGIFGKPTLINNIETFYYVWQIAKNKYKRMRFYSLVGQVKKKGVYELPLGWSIERVLKETGNWPSFDFFVQAGGGACGEVLLPQDLKKQVGGPGAIIVFNRKKTNPFSLMKKWANFFLKENCDKCLSCREGIYRLKEMIEKGRIDQKLLKDLTLTLKEASFCGLGKVASTPFNTLINKLLK